MSHTIHLNSPDKLHDALYALRKCGLNGSHEVVIRKLPKTRTAKQNRALHKWFRLVSAELNDRGLTVPVLLSKAIDVDWDSEGLAFKKLVWSKLQSKMIDKESTAEANTDEYPQIFEALNRWLANEGVHVAWPCKETIGEMK